MIYAGTTKKQQFGFRLTDKTIELYMEIKETLKSGGELVVDKNGWNIRYYFNGPDLRYNGQWVYSNGNKDAWIDNYHKFLELQEVFKNQKFCVKGKEDMYITERGVTLLDDFYHLNNSVLPINCQNSLDAIIADYEYAKSVGPRLSVKVDYLSKGLPAPSEEEIDEALKLKEEKETTTAFFDIWKLNKRTKKPIIALLDTINEYHVRISPIVKLTGKVLLFMLAIIYLAIGCGISSQRSLTQGYMYERHDTVKEMGYYLDFFIYAPLSIWCIFVALHFIIENYKKHKNTKSFIYWSTYTAVNSIILMFSVFSDAHSVRYVESEAFHNSIFLWFPINFDKYVTPIDIFMAYDLTEYAVYVMIPLLLCYLFSQRKSR